MTLQNPFKISARLLPALEVGGAWIQLEHVGNAGGRMVYRWTIDLPDGSEHSAADLKSGCNGATLQEMFSTLLSFLGAAAEAYRYEMSGRKSENADLFPPAVTEWAYQHSDTLSMLEYELEETPDLIAD